MQDWQSTATAIATVVMCLIALVGALYKLLRPFQAAVERSNAPEAKGLGNFILRNLFACLLAAIGFLVMASVLAFQVNASLIFLGAFGALLSSMGIAAMFAAEFHRRPIERLVEIQEGLLDVLARQRCIERIADHEAQSGSKKAARGGQ